MSSASMSTSDSDEEEDSSMRRSLFRKSFLRRMLPVVTGSDASDWLDSSPESSAMRLAMVKDRFGLTPTAAGSTGNVA